MLRMYEPSGRVGRLWWMLFPILIVVSVAVGAAYQWLITKSGVERQFPLVFLFAILTLAGIVYVAAGVSRLRNPGIAIVAGASIGFSAPVGGWALLYRRDPAGLPAQRSFVAFVQHRYQDGVKPRRPRLSRTIPARGPVLLGVWCIELIGFTAACAIAARSAASEPVCPECNADANKQTWKHQVVGADPAAVRSLCHALGVEDLLLRPAAAAPSRLLVRYTLLACPCEKTRIIRVERCTLKGKKQKETDISTILERAIDEPDVAALQHWAARPAPLADSAPP